MSENEDNIVVEGYDSEKEIEKLRKDVRKLSVSCFLLTVCICALCYGVFNTSKTVSTVISTNTELAEVVDAMLRKDAEISKLKSEYEEWALTDEGKAWLEENTEAASE